MAAPERLSSPCMSVSINTYYFTSSFLSVSFASSCLSPCCGYFVCQVKLASKRFLAGSLGLAAGVMLYVSLVEIFVKSQIAFEAHGYGTVSALTDVPC